MDDIERMITLETARQREVQPEAPPWNVIFRTVEEFDKAESLVEFCRAAILERAAGILTEKERAGR